MIYLSSYCPVRTLSYLVSDHYIPSAKNYCSTTKEKFSIQCKFIYIIKAKKKKKPPGNNLKSKPFSSPIYFSWSYRCLKVFLYNFSTPKSHTIQNTCLFYHSLFLLDYLLVYLSLPPMDSPRCKEAIWRVWEGDEETKQANLESIGKKRHIPSQIIMLVVFIS